MNYEFKIDNHNLEKFITYYKHAMEMNDDPRILHSFKTPEFRITIFNTKKVLFQGKKAYDEYALWAQHFGLEIPEETDKTDYVNEYYKQRIIGSDEVGTGDYFGPIVVCAALAGPKDYALLDDLGVRDSKTLTDKQIMEIGSKLIENLNYHVLVLNPEKFNELTEKGYNMNKIKAYLHNHAIKKMIAKNLSHDNVVVDEFCSPENYFKYLEGESAYKNIKFHQKGESIHKAVAVASIIARYKFLLEMDELSKSVGITLPKGAGGPADAIGKVIYLQKGKEIFNRIAKLSF